jgi:aspartyl-tRNA(Asn)/glutamyl-tRNA(Gln) amidotransferase subunit A
VLVAYEAAQLYHPRLRDAPERFDAETRSRLLAASMVSDAWRKRAIHVQYEFDRQLRSLFDHVDLLLAPCVPMVAPRADALDRPQPSGAPLRASLGQFTQPISLAGCPVVSLPLPTEAGLPTAIQLIGPVGSDAKLLRFAQDIAA